MGAMGRNGTRPEVCARWRMGLLNHEHAACIHHAMNHSVTELLPTSKSRLPEPKVGLAFLVSQVGGYAVNAFAAHLQPLDLTPHHVGILRLLALKPEKLVQTELASRLGVLPSRLVVLLDEMASRGLLVREANPDDRRSNVLRITSAGVQAFGRIEEATARLEHELFAGLSSTNRSELTRILTQLADQLGLKPGVHPSYRNLSEG